jgi:hypothetical protein
MYGSAVGNCSILAIKLLRMNFNSWRKEAIRIVIYDSTLWAIALWKDNLSR